LLTLSLFFIYCGSIVSSSVTICVQKQPPITRSPAFIEKSQILALYTNGSDIDFYFQL